MRIIAVAALSMLALAGCAAESRLPPVSLAPTQSGGPPDTEPQSVNSLPLGSEVQAPFTPAAGQISNVQVGPAGGRTPVTATTPPIAGTGTATSTGRPNRVTNGY